MVALRLVFVIPSRRNVNVVSGGSNAEMLNAREHMSRVGGMLGAMIAAMALTKNAAGTSLLRNRTDGVAPSSGGFAAAIDLRVSPRVWANYFKREGS
jgi:hypothetical protein